MAIARTGVFVDDYLEYSSTLAAELRRLLSTMRELDERAQGIISQSRDQTKYYIGMHAQSSKKTSYEDDDSELEKIKKEIEANQENALSLCTEKVVLAKQAYDLDLGLGNDSVKICKRLYPGVCFLLMIFFLLIRLERELKLESHVKRLDEDLNQFAEDLKQEGKIPLDEPAILPPLPMVGREEKRKGGYITPQSKRFRGRDWDREREMDLELMPPPGSHKKSVIAASDFDQSIDPNEPTYCVCHQVSFGDMIACDNENCEGGEWFHYSCVGLTPETRFKGKWFCPTCRQQP